MITEHTDNSPDRAEDAIAAGWAKWEQLPEGDERNELVGHLWNLEDAADNRGDDDRGCEIDDLRRDVILDRLASIEPECVGDLLELVDRVIEVAA